MVENPNQAKGIRPFKLNPAEVHVWTFNLNIAPFRLRRLHECLSESERKKAARFKFPIDGAYYTAAHGILRIILGAYLSVAPDVLCFATAEHGKPYLAGRHGWLKFNLSHSRALAAIAVSGDYEVGIDIEAFHEIGMAEIARTIFTPGEWEEWRTLPDAQEQAGFFEGWVRKEAYLKMLGTGLSREPATFSLSLSPEISVIQVRDPLSPEIAKRCVLYRLPCNHEVAAAVSIADSPAKVLLYDMDQLPLH